ncbi:high-affinity nicotinic acid transporter [Cordyceps javanica]|uniref:High-affinity nicotinic acid transporter n=1 Tax=Cordyceps javanica TaxID=43265 RepID=A0A545VC76_9HYPO|nr:high-affinity nicotinic acid transporter [Cordyceps javanica]
MTDGTTTTTTTKTITTTDAIEHNDQLEARAAQVDEQTLLRKLDLHLIPLIMMLYLFSFLDRVNIGNARLYGLEEDLRLTPTQFQTAVSVFFVPYLLLEVPSNLVLKRFTPRRWIAALAVAWGLVATLSGLAGSYGGLLAFGIGHMDGVAGLRGWRWILVLEGIPSVLLGVAAYAALPNDPGSARFLSAGERALMELRHRREYGNTASSREFSFRDVNAAFRDWKVWAFCVAQFGVDTMLYGYSTFLPTIIKGLGKWTPAQVQLLTIPCYFLGAAAYMAIATVSDRTQKRGLFCVIFGVVSVVGYAVLLSDASSGVHYFACFLVAAGLYIVVGLPLAWLPNNSPRYGKRTTATGMQLTIGNASGIMSSFIYPTPDAPRFIRGHAVTLSMVAMGTLIYGLLWAWYRRENERRAAGAVKEKYQNMSDDELRELGDESPHYIYMI